MSSALTLAASVRESTGKNANRKLRARGLTPAVFYRAGEPSLPLEVNEAALRNLYDNAGRSTVFDLAIDDKGTISRFPCLIWDTESYPTKNRFQHVDFFGVDLNREIKVRVPLEFTGTAKGTKLGGRLEVYREQIFILSKPAALPKKILVDISDLDVGQGLRVADLAMPTGVRAAYDINFAVLAVSMPGTGKEQGDEEL